MDHTCRDLESIPNVGYARKIGIPGLAAENQGILCSIMAMGAACLCIDLLLGRGSCDRVHDLSELISAGDRYHKIGMQSIRLQMTTNQPRDLAEAHAHAMLLFPYALARRRISYLLNNSGPNTPVSSVGIDSGNPSRAEWMILLRGITTTGRACWSDSSVYMTGLISLGPVDGRRKPHPTISSYIQAKMSEPKDDHSGWANFRCFIASKHPLFPVVSATRLVALEALQKKVEGVSNLMRDHHRKDVHATNYEKTNVQLAQSLSLAACSMAVDFLIDLCNTLFDPEYRAANPPLPAATSSGPRLEDSPMPWLRRYAGPVPYDPTIPALKHILGWVNNTPEEYFQLLLRSLPDQIDHQVSQSIDIEIQLLAWDIWAHWLVLVILVEEESFFSGNLGVPDIISLSLLFRKTSTPESSSPSSLNEHEQAWWPGNMCSVAQQLRRYHIEGFKG